MTLVVEDDVVIVLGATVVVDEGIRVVDVFLLIDCDDATGMLGVTAVTTPTAVILLSPMSIADFKAEYR